MTRGRSVVRKEAEEEKKEDASAPGDGNEKGGTTHPEREAREASPGRSPSPVPRRQKQKVQKRIPFSSENRTILVSAVFSVCIVLIGMLAGRMTTKEIVPRGGDVERFLFEKVQALDAKLLELREDMKLLAAVEELSKTNKEIEKMKEQMGLHEAKVKRTIDSWKGRPVLTKEQLQDELDRISADKTGRVDYALYAGGGRVVGHSPLTSQIPAGGILSYLPWPLNKLVWRRVHPNANTWVLMPSGGVTGLSEMPGSCLPLNGSSGYIDIRLREAIVPDAITLEHIPKGIAYNPGSAPKEFEVDGWLGSRSPPAEGLVSLGSFSYDVEARPVQTFTFRTTSETVDHIRFHLLSNHGHDTYTCVYRIRIHGLK